MSVTSSVDPQSLSSLLSIAICIAQRMGIHSELASAKCTPFETEMRRRLWWSLMLFESRIGEIANSKSANFSPIWDCKLPLNVTDSELRPEMKEPPPNQTTPTDAIFAVVWSEIGDFVRRSRFHLRFTNPALKLLAKDHQHGSRPNDSEVLGQIKSIESKYLRLCDPENPLHFMTIWMSRRYLAKCGLVEHYSERADSSLPPTDTQRDTAFFYALDLLQCDTKVMTSPLTKGYKWLAHFHFPMPAYIHLVQDLRSRIGGEHAIRAWEAMSDNYEVRIRLSCKEISPHFRVLIKIVLQAWEAREAAFKRSGEPLVPPRIISYIKQAMTQTGEEGHQSDREQTQSVMSMKGDDFPMSSSIDFGSHGMLYDMEGQDCEQNGFFDMSQLDWSKIDCGFGTVPIGW